MNDGTLIVIAVLLGSGLLMIFLGCVNPFVPKRYQKMVKKVHRTQIGGDGKEIPIKMRYDSSAYLGLSIVLIVAATVVHILVKYPSVEAYFARSFWTIISSFLLWVFIIATMEVFYVIAAFLAETMVIQSTEKYYKRFGFKAVDVRLAEIRS